MKVIEYLKKFSFAELKTELEKLYINNECCGFYNFTIEQWNAIYNLFGYQKDVETANVIHLIDSWERSCPLIDMNCMVCDKEFNLLHFITCVIPSNNQAVEVPQAYPTHSSNNCTHDAYILPNI